MLISPTFEYDNSFRSKLMFKDTALNAFFLAISTLLRFYLA